MSLSWTLTTINPLKVRLNSEEMFVLTKSTTSESSTSNLSKKSFNLLSRIPASTPSVHLIWSMIWINCPGQCISLIQSILFLVSKSVKASFDNFFIVSIILCSNCPNHTSTFPLQTSLTTLICSAKGTTSSFEDTNSWIIVLLSLKLTWLIPSKHFDKCGWTNNGFLLWANILSKSSSETKKNLGNSVLFIFKYSCKFFMTSCNCLLLSFKFLYKLLKFSFSMKEASSQAHPSNWSMNPLQNSCTFLKTVFSAVKALFTSSALNIGSKYKKLNWNLITSSNIIWTFFILSFNCLVSFFNFGSLWVTGLPIIFTKSLLTSSNKIKTSSILLKPNFLSSLGSIMIQEYFADNSLYFATNPALLEAFDFINSICSLCSLIFNCSKSINFHFPSMLLFFIILRISFQSSSFRQALFKHWITQLKLS